MNATTRDLFDRLLDDVLAEMPPYVHDLIDEVPLIVEDHPSEHVMQTMGVRSRRDLCGLYSGIPISDKSLDQAAPALDQVMIYREGVIALADYRGRGIDRAELRRQIRITLLHELGHHHGLDEDDLRELGYE